MARSLKPQKVHEVALSNTELRADSSSSPSPPPRYSPTPFPPRATGSRRWRSRSRASCSPSSTRTGCCRIVELRDTFYAGNFNGWIQYRKELPHEDDFSRIPAP